MRHYFKRFFFLDIKEIIEKDLQIIVSLPKTLDRSFIIYTACIVSAKLLLIESDSVPALPEGFFWHEISEEIFDLLLDIAHAGSSVNGRRIYESLLDTMVYQIARPSVVLSSLKTEEKCSR
jgi:hypothetical protein